MAVDIYGGESGRPINSRTVLRDDNCSKITVFLDGTNSYDGSNTGYEKVIRAGAMVAKNGSTGLYVPVKITTVSESPATSASINTFTVVNSAFFQVGDVIDVGVTTSRTITSVNYTTHSITVDGSAFNPSNTNVVKSSTSGCELAIGILLSEVELRDAENRNNKSKEVEIAVNGFVNSDLLLGDYTAAAAQSGNKLSNFVLDSTYGY